MLALSVVLSWLGETVLLHQAYRGNLEYTAALGPALPGGVPAMIPLTWFTMTYASYVLANLILDGRLTWVRCAIWRVIWLSFITAVIHTAWDLSRNPTMSSKLGAWIWHDGGEYFGVPYASFQYWIAITAAITLLYRLIERHIPLRPIGGRITMAAALVPILLYAMSAVANIVGGWPMPVRLIAAFAMGMPVFLALNRLVGANAPRVEDDRLCGEEQAR
jgi:putative membrane protein